MGKVLMVMATIAVLAGCGDADDPAVWPGPGVAPRVDAGTPDAGLSCGDACAARCGQDTACASQCRATECGGG